MGNDDVSELEQTAIPVIRLEEAPGSKATWGRPSRIVYSWAIVERLLVRNSWQISSRLRAKVLKAFGAEIGRGVILRPGLRVTSPWKLAIGENSWIGDGVTIHNQDYIRIGSNAVISQEAFLTTGSHAYKTDMALITRPIVVEDGAWITTRAIVLGGSRIGVSALVGPGSVVKGEVPDGHIARGNPARVVKRRFKEEGPDSSDRAVE